MYVILTHVLFSERVIVHIRSIRIAYLLCIILFATSCAKSNNKYTLAPGMALPKQNPGGSDFDDDITFSKAYRKFQDQLDDKKNKTKDPLSSPEMLLDRNIIIHKKRHNIASDSITRREYISNNGENVMRKSNSGFITESGIDLMSVPDAEIVQSDDAGWDGYKAPNVTIKRNFASSDECHIKKDSISMSAKSTKMQNKKSQNPNTESRIIKSSKKLQKHASAQRRYVHELKDQKQIPNYEYNEEVQNNQNKTPHKSHSVPAKTGRNIARQDLKKSPPIFDAQDFKDPVVPRGVTNSSMQNAPQEIKSNSKSTHQNKTPHKSHSVPAKTGRNIARQDLKKSPPIFDAQDFKDPVVPRGVTNSSMQNAPQEIKSNSKSTHQNKTPHKSHSVPAKTGRNIARQDLKKSPPIFDAQDFKDPVVPRGVTNSSMQNAPQEIKSNSKSQTLDTNRELNALKHDTSKHKNDVKQEKSNSTVQDNKTIKTVSDTMSNNGSKKDSMDVGIPLPDDVLKDTEILD